MLEKTYLVSLRRGNHIVPTHVPKFKTSKIKIDIGFKK
jgi:hypothetical protein